MVGMEMWQKVEALIDAKGLNWADLARLMGVKDSRISKWRSGTGEVDRKQIVRMAKILETGVEYLADDSVEDLRAAQRLTEDEQFILKTVRSIGWSAQDFVRKVYGVDPAKSGEAPQEEAPSKGKPVRLDIKQRSQGKSKSSGETETA